MKTEEGFITEEEIVVPESALLRVERDSGYGSVPGLEDEELASPAELERQAFLAEWGPILALPCKGFNGGIRPIVDEFGHLDWGAFGTVDFLRLREPFDKARYKADKLAEQLRWAVIMLGTVQERLSMEARLEVLALIRSGVDLDAIAGEDRHSYAKWYMRARSLREQIRELREFSRQRRLSPAPGIV
jgi:hypothetical protein